MELGAFYAPQLVALAVLAEMLLGHRALASDTNSRGLNSGVFSIEGTEGPIGSYFIFTQHIFRVYVQLSYCSTAFYNTHERLNCRNAFSDASRA